MVTNLVRAFPSRGVFCSCKLLSNWSGSHWCSASVSRSLHLINISVDMCVCLQRDSRDCSLSWLWSQRPSIICSRHSALCECKNQAERSQCDFFLGAAHYVHVGALLNEPTCSLSYDPIEAEMEGTLFIIPIHFDTRGNIIFLSWESKIHSHIF